MSDQVNYSEADLWLEMSIMSALTSQSVTSTGRNIYCLDKNYGGILIIWDRLFGKMKRFGFTLSPNSLLKAVWAGDDVLYVALAVTQR